MSDKPARLPDIEIARQAKIQPIEEIAAKLGIHDDDLEHYGKYKAKVSLDLYQRLKESSRPASWCWSRPSRPRRPAKARPPPASACATA